MNCAYHSREELLPISRQLILFSVLFINRGVWDNNSLARLQRPTKHKEKLTRAPHNCQAQRNNRITTYLHHEILVRENCDRKRFLLVGVAFLNTIDLLFMTAICQLHLNIVQKHYFMNQYNTNPLRSRLITGIKNTSAS